jgi:hypothetical protein
MNSIGNLLLHLTGNLQQWIVCGLGNQRSTRDRPSEFSAEARIPKAEVQERLRSVVQQAQATMFELKADELLYQFAWQPATKEQGAPA